MPNWHKAFLFCVSLPKKGHLFLYSCCRFLSSDKARSNPGETSLNKKIVTGEQKLLVRVQTLLGDLFRPLYQVFCLE